MQGNDFDCLFSAREVAGFLLLDLCPQWNILLCRAGQGFSILYGKLIGCTNRYLGKES